MKLPEDKRLSDMRAMLTAIAQGNFSYRIERTQENDIIESLVVLLNMTAEELEVAITHRGYMNSRTSYFNNVKLFFLLGEDDKIKAINPGATQLLKRNREELISQKFSNILKPVSKKLWKQHRKNYNNENFIANYLELQFDTNEKLPLVLACDVIELISAPGLPSMKIVVSARLKRNKVERESRKYRHNLLKNHLAYNSPLESDILLQFTDEDIQRIRDIRNYLLNNLDKPVDSLVNLARTFGTNEYKLKSGFKQLNGETISVFIQKERIKRAAILIEHSSHLIKEIAVMTGFKSNAHFSRNFKKYLGVSPKQYRQNLSD